jgi:hypothetical protein
VLQTYLNAKETVSRTILQTDQVLTDKEIQSKGEQEMEPVLHDAQES